MKQAAAIMLSLQRHLLAGVDIGYTALQLTAMGAHQHRVLRRRHCRAERCWSDTFQLFCQRVS
jgi:hypothetical protein